MHLSRLYVKSQLLKNQLKVGYSSALPGVWCGGTCELSVWMRDRKFGSLARMARDTARTLPLRRMSGLPTPCSDMMTHTLTLALETLSASSHGYLVNLRACLVCAVSLQWETTLSHRLVTLPFRRFQRTASLQEFSNIEDRYYRYLDSAARWSPRYILRSMLGANGATVVSLDSTSKEQ